MKSNTGKIIKIITLTMCIINFFGTIAIGSYLIEKKVYDLGITILVIGLPLALLIACLFIGFATIVDAASIYKFEHIKAAHVSTSSVPAGPVAENKTVNVAVPAGETKIVQPRKYDEWICPGCGSTQSTEHDACRECGTLNPKNHPVMVAPAEFFCEKCGARNAGTSKFCIKCGTQRKQQ